MLCIVNGITSTGFDVKASRLGKAMSQGTAQFPTWRRDSLRSPCPVVHFMMHPFTHSSGGILIGGNRSYDALLSPSLLTLMLCTACFLQHEVTLWSKPLTGSGRYLRLLVVRRALVGT